MIKNLLPSVWRKNDNVVRRAQESPFLPLQREMNKLFSTFFEDFSAEAKHLCLTRWSVTAECF
jgi:hypothetical protein